MGGAGVKHFFITGLPRCRTAWLANLFTWGPSFCFHEALNRSVDPSRYHWLLTREVPEGTIYSGDSDSGLPIYWREIMPMFPDAKVLFVWRAFEEAALAAHNAYKAEGIMDDQIRVRDECVLAERQLEHWFQDLPASNRMFAAYDSLGNEATIRQIWDFILPDVEYPRARIKMLQNLRVTQIMGKVIKTAITNESVLERATTVA